MSMFFKKLHKRSFLGGTAAHSLQQHPFEADSATRPSQAGFFIKDELSDYRFLVDTGAFRSILPPPGDINTINHPSSSDLVAANGTSIRTYGEQQVNIRLSGQAYTWTFIIADVRHPLLGADFLSHYSLMVDVARNRLLNIDSFTSTPLCISNIEENINLLSPDGNYADVLEDFDDVFKPELCLSPESSAKHGVQHYIKTTGPPVFSKYRRLRPELLQVAKDAFMEMEKIGVCSKAASPWASPLHMTPKKDGTWRPCGDYRRLNLITEPDHYAMPNISDLTSSIGTSRVFSKLDLLKGYFQVPVNPEDEPKTAITTHFGTYVFHYSTFGLRNSVATFQRMMDQIFGHLPYCRVYIDDILVASENHREHREHLQSVLELLRKNGLINAAANQNRAIIHTDSLTAIQILTKNKESERALCKYIYDTVKHMEDKPVINWIPSHVGITGNELADKYAKEGLQREVIDHYVKSSHLKIRKHNPEHRDRYQP